MSRLADYFVIVGYDHEKERSGTRSGKILQRFPESDWHDTPFIEGIEWFCQPLGWALSTERQEPRFFVSVLTDIDANRHYCACLCFNETISITPNKPIDEEEETLTPGRALIPAVTTVTHHSIMYAPKCLVLVSRLDYTETFRNCLGTIYTVYIESLGFPLETLIGNILGCIQVPPPGGPQVRFSIGAGDKQALQPPLYTTLPVTGTSVDFLFTQLGIKNVLLLFCAMMTEHKILFHSKSYSRLTDSCRALTALMYPFRYSHVYIPILPASLIEVLSTPTPFIMGVHSSLQSEITDLLDIIIADIDGGSIHIPESLVPPVSKLPHTLWETTQLALTLVLQPELQTADMAFGTQTTMNGELSYRDVKVNRLMRDKEIRAVFMRMFAQLLQGYRSCLTIIRIHPRPVITFHKAGFLGARDLMECDFLSRVLDSMFFTGFVTERGPPWRPCDAWDELYSSMSDLQRAEQQNTTHVLSNIQELAQVLYTNESPNPQTYTQKVLKPPEGAFARIHQPPMPQINSQQVTAIIKEGMVKNDLQSRFHTPRMSPRIVPMGPHLQSISDGRPVVNNTARRLEVLKSCVNCIFENKIAEARKSFPAVLRTLKQRDARLTLCRELAKTVQGNKAMLEHQQFDLVVKLMNRALQDDTSMDEHGVAAALLPLSTVFCRKLCTGVIQFSYTCIQDHPVWKNQQFWEAAFYQDVQTQIKALYLTRSGESSYATWKTENGKKSPSSSPEYRLSRIQEPSALEIAAEQMRIWPSYEQLKQGELIKSEESTLYSQAIHYANRMVSLLIPPDVNVGGKVQKLDVHVEDDTSVSNSVVESHSHSEHSDEGFEESDTGECGSAVAKMVCRFIDRVCTEGGVTADHLRNLHAMVPGVVHMHIEMLEAVHRESKRIPPVQKAKIHAPSLLSGEEIMAEPMRVYLLADGREDNVSALLPAEGALFLTNYRVVFKGSPCDQLACEQSIVRAFPVSSLTKEKRISVLYLPHLDQNLPEGLQMRSCTFQLIKVAFDEEVTVESIESFRKLLHRVRHPEHEFGRFAFASHGMHIQTPLHKVKEKNATLKGFAKKTLMRTAKKAGFKPKGGTKRKYILSGIDSEENHGHDNNEDDDASDDNADTMPRVTAKDVERLKERSYVKDWERLYLSDPMSGYRITTVNCNYSLCRTYPAILVSPHRITDDQLRCIARCYKNQRIPVPTWRHRNGAILLRGSVPHAKGVMGMLKAHQGSTNAATDSTAFQEQDHYFVTVIDNLPHTVTPMRHHQWEMSNSNLSINSLLLAAEDHHFGARTDNLSTLTPEIARKSTSNVFQTAKTSFGNFSGRAVKNVNKWGSLKSGPSQLRTPDGLAERDTHQYDFQRVPLYMLGEKSQSKSARLSEMYAEFIPVDYPDVRHTRMAFKKLMRACLPSSVTQEPDQSFAKLLEQSDWLQQIRGLLQLSGAVVDLIDMQGSSVTLALEDGWDVTAQVSSLAQLCLDPYYRTVEGFRVLIEKEWLAFGHRFGHRSNLRPHSSSGSPFAPTFLQFLDAVHQIQTQFPLAFEFNDFFLRFLAYHSVSCRFRTFLFDCELERFDLGIATVEDKRGSLNSHHKHAVETGTGSDDDSIYPGGLRNSSSSTQKLGHSVFDYLERQHAKSPSFFNFTYTPDPDRQVLRPQSSVAMLELWGFYVDEEIAHGPPYDPELVGSDNLDEESDTAEGRKPKRKVISVGYDSLDKLDPDAFSRLLEELKQAEAERGLLPQKWRQVWDKLELPHSDSLTRHASFSSALVRSHGRLQHKRSTLEILMRGRLAGHHQETFSHPHRFEKHAYTTPSHCNHCDGLLWGPMRTELRCMDCGNSYHEKCAETVPKNCTKYKAVEGVQQTLTRSQGDNGSITSSATAGQTSLQHFYDQFSSNVAENRTHEGHLYKRGALLKSWKQRWFVLDSIKHQLRYYDAMEDSNCKGFIDLAEVQSVQAAPSAAVGTKKVDEKAFFDLKTSRRTYNFYALDANMAQEWIEKIQACLQ